jgi:hypothetical protein
MGHEGKALPTLGVRDLLLQTWKHVRTRCLLVSPPSLAQGGGRFRDSPYAGCAFIENVIPSFCRIHVSK